MIYLGTFSKILSPGCGSGGPRRRARCSRSSTWASRAPTCARRRSGSTSSSSTSPSATGATCSARCASSTAAGATRCWMRSRSTSRPRRSGRARAAGCSSGPTLPDYIDTTDLLARALREHVAFVPGRAAYLDGRGGSSMRLNFSGVGDVRLREGVARIGKVVYEQLRLYSTLTGAEPARRGARARRGRVERRPRRAPAPARGMSRVAVLGRRRSLERQVSLRSGARVRDALESLGHDVIARRRTGPGRTARPATSGRRVRRAAGGTSHR